MGSWGGGNAVIPSGAEAPAYVGIYGVAKATPLQSSGVRKLSQFWSITPKILVDSLVLTLLKGRSYEDEPNHPPRCTSAAIYGPSGYPAHLRILRFL